MNPLLLIALFLLLFGAVGLLMGSPVTGGGWGLLLLIFLVVHWLTGLRPRNTRHQTRRQ